MVTRWECYCFVVYVCSSSVDALLLFVCVSQAWIFAAVFGIGMLFVDAILIILRLTQMEKAEAKKKAANTTSQPLGVRAAVGAVGKKNAKKAVLSSDDAQLPDLSAVKAAESTSHPSSTPSPFRKEQLLQQSYPVAAAVGSDASLDAATRAFESLMAASSADGTPTNMGQPSAIKETVLSEESSNATGTVRRRPGKSGK